LIAESFADIYIAVYIKYYCLSDIIVSKRITRFNLDFWRYLTVQWETKSAFSSTFHSQNNRQAVKANSNIKRFLRALPINKQKSWDNLIPIAEYAYNSYAHYSTGVLPAKADFDYNLKLPLDTLTTIQHH
jgi:hypothetical protein